MSAHGYLYSNGRKLLFVQNGTALLQYAQRDSRTCRGCLELMRDMSFVVGCAQNFLTLDEIPTCSRYGHDKLRGVMTQLVNCGPSR